MQERKSEEKEQFKERKKERNGKVNLIEQKKKK